MNLTAEELETTKQRVPANRARLYEKHPGYASVYYDLRFEERSAKMKADWLALNDEEYQTLEDRENEDRRKRKVDVARSIRTGVS